MPSSPTSDVPGMAGLKFGATTNAFRPPFGSPNGELWVFVGVATGGSLVVVGSGTDGANAAVVARRHDPTFFDPSVTFLTFRLSQGINDAGSFVFGSDTNAPTGFDEVAVRGRMVGEGELQHYEFDLVGRENTQLPGQPLGFDLGPEGRFIHMLDDDTVALSGWTTGAGLASVYVCGAPNGGRVIVEGGVTIPEDQAPPQTPNDGSIPMFRADATGDTYMYTAFLIGGGVVIAVNNVVVAEDNRPLPGGYPGEFYTPEVADEGPSVAPHNGHYAFRNSISTAGGPRDAVIMDGAVTVVTGDPVIFGSSELFIDSIYGIATTFQLNSVNSSGDYVLVGHSDATSSRRQVWVWNRRILLAREGDPVDLNGDGLGNDDVYLGVLDDDEAGYLTDNGRVYFTADLHSSPTGPKVGEAFMWLPVPIPGDPNCDGRIDFFDIDPFLLALFDENAYATAYPDCWRITADINRDGSVDFFDIDPFLACLFDECP